MFDKQFPVKRVRMVKVDGMTLFVGNASAIFLTTVVLPEPVPPAMPIIVVCLSFI